LAKVTNITITAKKLLLITNCHLFLSPKQLLSIYVPSLGQDLYFDYTPNTTSWHSY